MKSTNQKLTPMDIIDKLGAWLIVLVISVLLTIVTDTFFTVSNIINVIRQITVVSIIALGSSFVVLGGEIDLSTGMAATFAGCNAALLMTKAGMSITLSILIALVVGTLVGTFTGWIVTKLSIPAFIGTLGMQYIILGMTLVFTKSMPVINLPEKFLVIGRGYIAEIIPVPTIIMAVFFVIGTITLKFTTFGRSVISVGENPVAANLSGLNVTRTKILIFTICGFCSAAAGIIQASRLSSGQPGSGADLSLQALAAVYIGGTFKGSMVNTLAGALAWGLINNGLNLLRVSAYWQKVALGSIIILSVLLDIVRAKRSTVKHK